MRRCGLGKGLSMDIRCEVGGGGETGIRGVVGVDGRGDTHGPEGDEVGDGVAGGIIKINKNFFSFFLPSADIVCVWLQGFLAVAAFVVSGGAVKAKVDEWTI